MFTNTNLVVQNHSKTLVGSIFKDKTQLKNLTLKKQIKYFDYFVNNKVWGIEHVYHISKQ